MATAEMSIEAIVEIPRSDRGIGIRDVPTLIGRGSIFMAANTVATGERIGRSILGMGPLERPTHPPELTQSYVAGHIAIAAANAEQ